MTLTAKSWWHRARHTRTRDILHGRIDGQLDWRQSVAGADLPVAVANTISQVIHKTRLWKREQMDVALELIAHFQDGLETGLHSEALLASFGDAASAARLIRRSKKRGRPFLWQANHFANWQYLAAAPATYFAGASRRELLAKHHEMWASMEAEAERPLWDPLSPGETAAGQYKRMSPFALIACSAGMSRSPAIAASALAIITKESRRMLECDDFRSIA